MLNGGYSWRLFFYVEIAFGVALLIFAFLVVEETTYHRKLTQYSSDEPEDAEKTEATTVERSVTARSSVPARKTYLQTLKFWGVWERDSEFFLMMARSFTYFLVPHVFWVVTTYGKLPFLPVPDGARCTIMRLIVAAKRHLHRYWSLDLQLYHADQGCRSTVQLVPA